MSMSIAAYTRATARMGPAAHKDQDKGQGQGQGQGAHPTGRSRHQREAPLEGKAVGEMLVLVRVIAVDHVHPIKQKKGMIEYITGASRFFQWCPRHFILLRVGTMNVNKSLSMIMHMKSFLLP